MSDHKMWKMLHLLYTNPNHYLNKDELKLAGVDCNDDSIRPLVDGKVVEMTNDIPAKYSLSQSVSTLLGIFNVAKKRLKDDNIYVDCPVAFVIMPFQEPWSEEVYNKMIKTAISNAGLICVRGDTVLRVGDLTTNIWREILKAGLIIADISTPNINVFYELGLTHAIGKDTIIFKQKDTALPADFGGTHYQEYLLNDLDGGRKWLEDELILWHKDKKVDGVKALYNM